MAEQNNERAVTPLQRFNRYITNPATQSYLDQTLQERKSSFVNNLIAIVSSDAKLQKCTPNSLMNAAYKATALDLPFDPNLGCSYIIPYENRKAGTSEASFQIGYKGLTQLALRSGKYQTVNVTDVKEGEIAGEDLLTGEIQFKWLPRDERIDKPVIGYVAYFKLLTGFSKMLYMSKAEVEAHALRYSQTYKSTNKYVKESSKWSTDFDAMARKTVLKLLLNKWGILSVEMREAIKYDQAVIKDDGTPEYVDGVDDQSRMQDEVDAKREQMREDIRDAESASPEDGPKDGLF